MKIDRQWVDGIRQLIADARLRVARGVDLVQVYTNFEIGRRIVEEEQRGEDRAAYGKQIIGTLAERLAAEFGKGFSETNLKLMRLFYLQNQDRIRQTASDEFSRPQIGQSVTGQFNAPPKGQTASDLLAILQTASGQSGLPAALRPFTLGWSHYVFLLGVKNPEERSFYEIEATEQNWTVRELRRQFDSGLYERLAFSRDKEGIRKLAREGPLEQSIKH